jgi:hypothetical protein
VRTTVTGATSSARIAEEVPPRVAIAPSARGATMSSGRSALASFGMPTDERTFGNRERASTRRSVDGEREEKRPRARHERGRDRGQTEHGQRTRRKSARPHAFAPEQERRLHEECERMERDQHRARGQAAGQAEVARDLRRARGSHARRELVQERHCEERECRSGCGRSDSLGEAHRSKHDTRLRKEPVTRR